MSEVEWSAPRGQVPCECGARHGLLETCRDVRVLAADLAQTAREEALVAVAE